MLRVTLRGAGVPAAVLGTGDRLLFGRAPGERLDGLDPDSQLRLTTLALPRTAPHVSRLVGELDGHRRGGPAALARPDRGPAVEPVRGPRWGPPGHPGPGMTALPRRGREPAGAAARPARPGPDIFTDIQLAIQVDVLPSDEPTPAPGPARGGRPRRDGDPGPSADAGAAQTREWYVATGAGRTVARRSRRLSATTVQPGDLRAGARSWHGYAWNLNRPARVDDALRAVARLAFGPQDDPFSAPAAGRAQNLRFAIGRRAAEVRLVTVDQLEQVEAEAAARPVRH